MPIRVQRPASILLALSCAVLAPSLLAHPDFSIIVHGTDEHAPRREVGGMAESRDGFLWVASADGLSRFDGLSFVTQPSETGHRTSQVFEDHFGGAWICSPDRSAWRWENGRFASLPQPPSPDREPWRRILGQRDGSALLMDFQSRFFHWRNEQPLR